MVAESLRLLELDGITEPIEAAHDVCGELWLVFDLMNNVQPDMILREETMGVVARICSRAACMVDALAAAVEDTE